MVLSVSLDEAVTKQEMVERSEAILDKPGIVARADVRGGDVDTGVSRMTVDRAQDEIIEEMARLGDWMEKYKYLVNQGRNLASMRREHKTEENLISGCQSRVWLHVEMRDGEIHLAADSDAMIVRGIIALVLRVLDGRNPDEVAKAELYFIERTGLGASLSPARADGLRGIVMRIREYGRLYSSSS
jgi:cysteine desulfuration protein SufE